MPSHHEAIAPTAQQPEASKTCTKCGHDRPESAFHRMGRGRRRTICGECRNEARLGVWRETPEQRRKRQLWSDYSLTLEQYAALLDAQGGVCAICSDPPAARKRLAVDHCHTTGVVRALLCNRCNLAVGFYENHGKAAAAYLSAYANGNPLLKK